MTNAKSTKRALLASIISILLCLSTLIGLTYAWFTDSATTGVNTIVAGNLDIALYKGTVDENGKLVFSTTETNKNTELFDKNALWEPGRVEVAYLKLVNQGNLAIKFTLAAHFANEQPALSVEGSMIYLSNHLKYDVLELSEATPFADRNAAKDAATSSITLTEGKFRKDLTGILENKNDEKYYAVVVYMPDTVGNEANYRGDVAPSIELGINLVATQQTYESDSFGDNYDTGAAKPTIDGIPSKPSVEVTTAGTLSDLQAAFAAVAENNGTDIVINITKDIVLKDGETWTTYTPTGVKNVTINGNGHKITGLTVPLMVGTLGSSATGDETITFNELTLENANISAPAYNNLGVGAFLAYSDVGGGVVFNDCHLVGSAVEAKKGISDDPAARAAGFVGYTSGKALTFTDCSVVDCTIKSEEDAAAFAGYVSAKLTITNCTASDTDIISEATDKCRTGKIIANIGGEAAFTNVTAGETVTVTQTFPNERAHDFYGRNSGNKTVTIK